MAFLYILFGETSWFDLIERIHPDYVIEKYKRYVESNKKDEFEWGMHPLLKERFDEYCERFDLVD